MNIKKIIKSKKMLLVGLMSFSFVAFCENKLSKNYSRAVQEHISEMDKCANKYISHSNETEKIKNRTLSDSMAELEEALFNPDQALFVRGLDIEKNNFLIRLKILHLQQKAGEVYLGGVKNHIDPVKKAYNDRDSMYYKDVNIKTNLDNVSTVQRRQLKIRNTLQEPQVKEYIARLART